MEDSDLLSFENFQKDFNKVKILKGLGTHQCLDFLNLSLSMPLSYAPQRHILKEYTKQMRQLLALKEDVMRFADSDQSQMNMLRAVNRILNWETDLTTRSDVTGRQASVVALESRGNQICGTNQTILIAQTQEMLAALQSKMRKVKAQKDNANSFTDFLNKEEEESKR